MIESLRTETGVSYGIVHHSKTMPVSVTACGLSARDAETGIRNVCPSSPKWEEVTCPKCIAARKVHFLRGVY
jgi:hypothetical protein